MGRPVERVGIDAAVFIYLLEQHAEFGAAARAILSTVETGSNFGILASIGLIEIMTGPKRRGEPHRANEYLQLLREFPHLSIYGLSVRVIDLASDLRAQYRLNTPDAIHVATAISAGAVRFITNDRALKKVKEVQVQLVSELEP